MNKLLLHPSSSSSCHHLHRRPAQNYAPYQYPFRAAIEGSMISSTNRRVPTAPCSTPVVTPLTAAQLAMQMAQEVEAQSAVNGRFYKTRMCLFYQKGACVKGSNCSYAHCESELRPAPDLMKTRLCQDWLNGNCTSLVCKFAHGRHELRFTHDFYKTKICHFWQQGGCTKGVFCRHAHGAHELRPSVDSGSSDGGENHLLDGSNDNTPGVRLLLNTGSSTRSSNRSNGGASPRAERDNTAAVFEALRLAAESRKFVERGSEILMDPDAAPFSPKQKGVTPSGRRLGHRSQHSCASERLVAKLSAPNSPLPPYGTAGSGLTVTTAAPSLAATYGHSTPTHGMNSPALSFSMPECAVDGDDLGLVDQLLETLLSTSGDRPSASEVVETTDNDLLLTNDSSILTDGVLTEGVLADAITNILSGWEGAATEETSQW